MRLVTLGFACNNACIFCAQGELRGEVAWDPEAALNAAIQRTSPGEIIAIGGGEPTLFDALPAWIQRFDRAGAARVVLQTNARRLAYRAYASALRAASSTLSLDVSLHGSSGPMHDYHTGTPQSFAQTILGIRHARAEGARVVVSCVVTRSNFRHLSELVRLGAALGISAIRFIPALAHGNAAASRDRVVPSPEMIAPHLAAALAEGKRLPFGARIDASGGAVEEGDIAFVGLGPVEEARRSNAPEKPADRRSLAIYGRPAPAVREARGSAKQSGDALRPLFPSLFDRRPDDVVSDRSQAASPVDVAPASDDGARARTAIGGA